MGSSTTCPGSTAVSGDVISLGVTYASLYSIAQFSAYQRDHAYFPHLLFIWIPIGNHIQPDIPPSNMQSPLCVIVVGGSIAGLTLAHCLDHAGIDYLVLEKHHDIGETCIGGPVGIQPNGARILAQLGLSAAISKVGEPVTTIHVGYPGGFDTVDDWPISVAERGVFH